VQHLSHRLRPDIHFYSLGQSIELKMIVQLQLHYQRINIDNCLRVLYYSISGQYAPEEPETQGLEGAVNEGLPKFSDLQKMWGHKVF